MITEKNRRHIFYLCNKLGLDSEARRNIQYSACGKESMKEMSDRDASAVIDALKTERRKQSVKRGRWKNRLGHGENVYNLMTPEQRKKITAMSIQVYGRFDEGRIDKFCRRQFKKPYRLLSSDDAVKLIEIQKSMLNRKLKEESA